MKTLEEIKKSGAPVCAFTFDDGPSDTTVRLLDIFKKYDCRASFFVVSAWGGEEGVSIMRRAVEQGCTIENHSKTHRDMRTMERSEIIAEYEATQKYVYDAVGDYPKFFRAPGLCVNDTVYDSVPLTFINGQCGSADWNSREDDPRHRTMRPVLQGFSRVRRTDTFSSCMTAEATTSLRTYSKRRYRFSRRRGTSS